MPSKVSAKKTFAATESLTKMTRERSNNARNHTVIQCREQYALLLNNISSQLLTTLVKADMNVKYIKH